MDDIYPVGNILWGKFYILWARGFIPWVYPVECRFQIYIPWGLYPVDDGSPRDIRVVVHGIYIPWVYPVGVIEFYRCTLNIFNNLLNLTYVVHIILTSKLNPKPLLPHR